MRCITIAEELRCSGASVLFICREQHGNMNAFLEKNGFEVVRLRIPKNISSSRSLSTGYALWLGVSWEDDASQTLMAIKKISPELLIVDHYTLDWRWEERLRPHVGRIMVIDDLANRQHDCDILLDQNLYESMHTRYAKLVPDKCLQLLGPKYALLRPEFATVRKYMNQRSGIVKKILVFFGAVDSTNETEKTLDALAGIEEMRFEVDVVVGKENPRQDRIKEICSSIPMVRFHCQISNMAELMAAADLAIGAGGGTTWERCVVGLPAIVVAVAENQVELSTCGGARGLFFYLGRGKSLKAEVIRDALRVLVSSPTALKSFAANGMNAVDGKGAKRIVGLLNPPKITLRLARSEDNYSVYQWRNAEKTRRHIFDSSLIEIENHRAWFSRTLESPNHILLIGEQSDKPIGVVRFDLNKDEALISVYLVPGEEGKGVGTELIRRGSRWLKYNRPKVKIINAEILRSNIRSLGAFEQAGYIEYHVTYRKVLR
jgi:UDP-2,4-diacetamido-2,4,6-trideoxy-beta-L-altropyranose hydrolase